jgi:hypothetical protein
MRACFDVKPVDSDLACFALLLINPRISGYPHYHQMLVLNLCKFVLRVAVEFVGWVTALSLPNITELDERTMVGKPKGRCDI